MDIFYNKIVYLGTEYKVREIDIPDSMEGALIGTESLKALLLTNGIPNSDEAENVDATIYCYVDDIILNLSDQDILKHIREFIDKDLD